MRLNRLIPWLLATGIAPQLAFAEIEAMRFELQTPPAPSDSLAVELNGYDVTAFAQIRDGQLVLALDMALAPGTHPLQVLAFAPNGNISTLLDLTITIDPSADTTHSWGANVSLDSSYRLDASPEADFNALRRLASQGGLALRSLHEREQVSVSTEVDALYDSNSENFGNGTGMEWALPNYRIDSSYRGDRLSAGATVGNIRLEQDDLLFSMFQRRGAEVRLGTADQSTELRLFEVNSEPVTRVDQALVLPGDELKGQGATLKTRLAGDALSLKLGYVDGKTRLGGAGIYVPGDAIIYGGDSWNLALDSLWLDGSIWLHAEYAESRFDSDGLDQGEDADTDSAHQLLAQVQSGGLPKGPFDYWSATFQHQAVGEQFYSLGNLSLPGDVALNRFIAQMGRQSVSLQMEWSSEVNNQADNPAYATQTLERALVNIHYVPMLAPDSLWQSLGSPSASLNLGQTHHSQPDTDADLVGFDLDNLTQEQGIGLQFSNAQWSWGLQWSATQMDDRSQTVLINGYEMYQPASDMDNQMWGLNLSWLPSTFASVNLYAQFNRQKQTDAGDSYHNRNLGFDTQLQLIQDQLLLGFNYNYGADSSKLADPGLIEDDFLSHFGNGQLTWLALAAQGNTPGVNVYLRGSYGKQDNRAFAWTQSQWSAHLGIELAWAAGEL